MAKLTGSIHVEGSVGNVCFYKTKQGFMVRAKSSLSKERIQSDPAFARTRESNADFSRAARAATLFRTAFKSLLKRIDIKNGSTLMSGMMKVIQADSVNLRGHRTVNDGQPILLEGLEFNQCMVLADTLIAPITASINRNRGKRNMVVDIPPFSPAMSLATPKGATHFRFISNGASIDFQEGTYNSAASESAILITGNWITRKMSRIC